MTGLPFPPMVSLPLPAGAATPASQRRLALGASGGAAPPSRTTAFRGTGH